MLIARSESLHPSFDGKPDHRGAQTAYGRHMLDIGGVEGLRERVGEEIGVAEWHEVSQARIDAFAAATEDFEPIHVDPERGRQTPFGTTIAHGLYTLSLGPKFLYEMWELAGISLSLNYGFNRVRFVSPVPVGSRVRMRARIAAVEEVAGGALVTVEQTFEIEGQERPACVAESLVLYRP